LSFTAAGVPRKNIQDQLGAIDYPAFGAPFEVAKLRGRKIAVKNDKRGVVQIRFDFQFLDFAAADHGRGIDLVAHLKNAAGHLRARAASQFREFLKRCALYITRVYPRHMGRSLEAHAYKEHALVAFCRTRSLHSALTLENKSRRDECNAWDNFTMPLYTLWRCRVAALQNLGALGPIAAQNYSDKP
jgi:hypothetical protein